MYSIVNTLCLLETNETNMLCVPIGKWYLVRYKFICDISTFDWLMRFLFIIIDIVLVIIGSDAPSDTILLLEQHYIHNLYGDHVIYRINHSCY